MKNKKKYSLSDHIVSNIILIFMIILIITSPFLVFYGLISVISFIPGSLIESNGSFPSIWILLKFFIITVMVSMITDSLFNKLLKNKKKYISTIIECTLMYSVFYLFVLVYSITSKDIHFSKNGILFVSIAIFINYALMSIFVRTLEMKFPSYFK